MKTIPTILLTSILACMLDAQTFEDFMKKAEQESTPQLRYTFWDRAADAGTNAEKTRAWSTAFACARKMNESEQIVKYGTLLKDCTDLSDKERAEACYLALKHMPEQEVGPDRWNAYLAMPGKSPAQASDAVFALANALRNRFQTEKALAVLEKVRTGSEYDINTKVDATLKIAAVLFSRFRNDEALKILEELEQNPALTPKRKGQLLILIGDSIKQGHGYYPNLEDADYEKAYRYFRKAAEIRASGKLEFYMQAYFKIIESLFTRGKYAETLKICEELMQGKKVKPGLDQWRLLKTYMGQCKTKLGDYEGAIADLEALRDIKYMPQDNCRYLGHAYYLNRQYSLAIGCYSEALAALEGAEDDRPAWCKHWIERLRWFAQDNNGEKLQKALEKYEGKTGSAGLSRKKEKKKTKTLEDINSASGNLAEDGLDIGF